MTTSTHVCSASVGAATLSVRGGTIVLDDAAAPHVQARVSVAATSLAVLAALDPRMSPAPRVTVSAHAVFPWGVQDRSFDLTLRDRRVRHSEGLVELVLSSDEALLEDYAPLQDDAGAFSVQTSLRAVVGFVLGKIGAALAAAPAGDADVTTYSTSTNYLANSAAIVDLAGWGSAVAGLVRQTGAAWAANAAKTAFRLNGSASNPNSYMQALFTNLAGKRLLFRARYQNGGGVTNPGGNASRLHAYYSTDGGASYTQVANRQGSTAAGANGDLWAVAAIPSNATHVLLRLYHGYASADSVFWSDVAVRDFAGDTTDTAYWDGATADTAVYVYDWQNGAGVSTATRSAIIDRTPDSLLWKAGTSALDFLAPIVQAAGYRLVCDEARVWTLRDEGYDAGGSLAIRHAVNLYDADDAISRSDALWCDAAVVVYTWVDALGERQERTDFYALTPSYTRLVKLERATAYPGPGFAEYVVRRAQGRGREVTATTGLDWTARAEQDVQIVLDGALTQVGKTSRVTFDLDRDEMTVLTRTTDTPPSAWVLIPTGQRWIDSPAGASWTSEAI